MPLLPFVQDERDIDVIFIIDGDTTTNNNITNGLWPYNTYLAAQRQGLEKMPIVPSSAQFVEQSLYTRAQFYGCHDQNVTTLIYFPNTNETEISATLYFYTPEQINSTFSGGAGMVSQGGDEEWPACLACGIMHKSDVALPEVCVACLEKYCWTS